MVVKKLINDRQRTRKTYGFVRRLPDTISLAVSTAESNISVLNLDWKESVRFASTGNLTFPPVSATAPIDGSTSLNNGDRILLKDQTSSSQNGIYVVKTSTNSWERAEDAIPGTSLTCGATVYVEDGTLNAGSKWVLSTKVITLFGSQLWVPFNAWVTNTTGEYIKTDASVSIGGDYTSTISPDIFFYVSGTIGPTSDSAIALFGGDVVINGSLNVTTGDGFFGDLLEVSGSVKITTGSLFLQQATTGDYVYFVNSNDGSSFQSGSAYLTGTLAQGYESVALAPASQATGLFSQTQRFGEYSQASSGFASNYTNNVLGKTQYSRLVWCGVAHPGDQELLFKGYDISGNLSPLFELEDDKTYSVKATAVISDVGDQTDSTIFVREGLFYKSGGSVTRTSLNSTLSLPNALNYDLDIVVSGSLVTPDTHIAFVVDPVGVASFGTVGDLKGTVTIELTEIQIT